MEDELFSEIEAVVVMQRNAENIYLRSVFKFVKGHYFLLIGNKEEGLRMMDKAMVVFNVSECFEKI